MKDIGHSSPVLNIDFFTDASRKAAEIVHFSHIVCSNDAKLRLFCAGAYFFSERNAMFL